MSLKEFAAWWDDLSDPKVATPARSLVEIKANIEKFCISNPCTYDMTSQVSKISDKLSNVLKQTKGK